MFSVRCEERIVMSVVILSALLGAGCGVNAAGRSESVVSGAAGSVGHGRQVWFEHTYGGEQFFNFLAQHPDPARRIRVGFDAVLRTPRASRFDVWGVINDPNCTASTDPLSPYDVCPDPHATGVIGLRKSTLPSGAPMYGLACASCHAGFDPLNPPANANEPAWANIHPTIGNAYLKTGAIFSVNLAATDPRRLMFAAWPNGTVDTSLLFSDNIMNPEAVTSVWQLARKPVFDVGFDEPKMRSAHGGEDDLGLDLLALRKYTSFGACFADCASPAVTGGQPISIDACRATCADFPAQTDLDDLGAFLESISAPQYPGARSGKQYAQGKKVFAAECATCHDDKGAANQLLSNDEVNPLAVSGGDATNACRALTTNWDAGQVWAEFASEGYKARAASGAKGYRTMPLAGAWATAPFLHNQSIGALAAAGASPADRALVFEQAMHELLAPARTPMVNRLPVALGPFPAGTPLALVFSRDPRTGAVLCSDVVENRGHHYGSLLSDEEKAALIEFLKFQ